MAEEKINAAPEQEQDVNELRQIRVDKLNAMRAEGKDPFTVTTAGQNIHSNEIAERFEELENKDVCICGRMMSRRDMGKANFIDVRDRNGRMQVYVKIDEVGEDVFADFKKWDIGDIIEVKGFVFKTRRGERYPFTQSRCGCSQSRCCRCPRSSTALPTPTCATAGVTSTSL